MNARRIVKNSVGAISVVHHKLWPKPNNGLWVLAEQLAMEFGQLIPRRGGFSVVGVVIAKVQYEPVHAFVAPGQDRAKGVSLLPYEVTLVL